MDPDEGLNLDLTGLQHLYDIKWTRLDQVLSELPSEVI